MPKEAEAHPARFPPIPNPGMDGEPGPLQKEFEAAHPAPADWTKFEVQPPPPTGVTDISIEQTPCYGFCSTYTMVLHSNGTVDYFGQHNIKLAGAHHGTIPREVFDRLAQLAIEIGFFDLDDDYRALATDQSTVYTAVTRNGARKLIRHYGPDRAGPQRLTAFEHEVENAWLWVEWDAGTGGDRN
jgi:hypothetical protein